MQNSTHPKHRNVLVRSAVRRRYVIFALATIAIYGDLLKRVMPNNAALVSLYVMCGFLLLVIIVTRRNQAATSLPAIAPLSGVLLITYFLQFSTGFNAELLPALMMLTYVCVPLAFLIVIPRAYPDFDIRSFAIYTALLMIPVHVIGLVQQYFDQGFMISTVYHESGGVIQRNFLDGPGTFSRMPSLFASADRYAGVSAAQVMLSLVLLRKTGRNDKRIQMLALLSLSCAAAGLLFAGSRSRILVVIAALLVAGIALLISALRNRLSLYSQKQLYRVFLIGVLLLFVAFAFPQTRENILDFPVVDMLSTTVEKGDAQDRFKEGIEISLLPEDVSFFGEGLGTSAEGRPGEFGIRAMWIEGGFFWTTIMLIIHAGIMIWFVVKSGQAIHDGDPILTTFLVGSGLFWLFGVMAGLSSSFELSLALILFPMTAVAAIASNKSRQRGVRYGATLLKTWS